MPYAPNDVRYSEGAFSNPNFQGFNQYGQAMFRGHAPRGGYRPMRPIDPLQQALNALKGTVSNVAQGLNPQMIQQRYNSAQSAGLKASQGLGTISDKLMAALQSAQPQGQQGGLPLPKGGGASTNMAGPTPMGTGGTPQPASTPAPFSNYVSSDRLNQGKGWSKFRNQVQNYAPEQFQEVNNLFNQSKQLASTPESITGDMINRYANGGLQGSYLFNNAWQNYQRAGGNRSIQDLLNEWFG